jgi:hypothetical protein
MYNYTIRNGAPCDIPAEQCLADKLFTKDLRGLKGRYFLNTESQLKLVDQCTSIDYIWMLSCESCTQVSLDKLELKSITGESSLGKSLDLYNSPVSSLRAFSTLSGALKGGVAIQRLSNLKTLNGLEGLTQVGFGLTGTGHGVSFQISHNPNLTDITALAGVEFTGNLSMVNNPKLVCVPDHWPDVDMDNNTIRQGPCPLVPSNQQQQPLHQPADTTRVIAEVVVAALLAIIGLLTAGFLLHRRSSSSLKAANIRRKTNAGDRDSVHSNPAYEANPMISEIQATTNQPMSSGVGAAAEQNEQGGQDQAAAVAVALDAEFDPVGCWPVNDAAKALYARQWLSQGKSSGKEPLHAVDYADIAKATDNFDQGHAIGGGASCTVYKADLFGVSCAIKVLEEPVVADAAHMWEVKQFIAEMVILGRVRHPNVCRLYAVSTNSTNKCLVLELMETSLDARLGWHAKEREAEQREAGQQVTKPPPPLSWRQRLNIAVCSCRGIVHLHQQKPVVVHRDVKSQNLLICGFETPQAEAGRVTLADFGTARREQVRKGSVDAALTIEATGMVVGTGPYMPTECECASALISHTCAYPPCFLPSDVNHGHVSVLTDSYAFGIMLIELLTDLHPVDARALVDEYSQLKDRIKAIEDAAKGIGWQDTRGARTVAAEVAASCTDGSATRTTAEQGLAKLERIAAPRASIFGDFNKRVL